MIFTGVFVALIDEKLIQAYFSTGRSSSFIDVGIDCAGYFFGVVALTFLLFLVRTATGKKNLPAD
jgi:VanZ family protein